MQLVTLYRSMITLDILPGTGRLTLKDVTWVSATIGGQHCP